MRSKLLLFFCLLAALGSLTLLAILISAPSSQANSIVAGLSAPRLVMAVVLLVSTLAFAAGALYALLRPAWALAADRALRARLGREKTLLAALFFTALIAVVIPAVALLGMMLNLGQVVRRTAELLLWAEMLAVLALGLLLLRFPGVYRQAGFFSDAPGKIVRASWLGKPNFWRILALLGFSALVLFLASPFSMKRVPGHDSGIFLYFGRQILHGQIPFRDLWDHKPPMIFYVDALGLLLGGGSTWGVWLLEYLGLAVSCMLGFWMLRRYFGDWAAGIGMTFSLGAMVFLLEGGNLTEEFSLPLQFGALMLFAVSDWRGWGGRGGAWRAFSVGVALTFALNFKQTMIGVWVALFIFLALSVWIRHERAFLYAFGWALVGAVLTQAGILIYFAAHRAVLEYWRVAFVYNLIYSDISGERRVKSLFHLWNFLAFTTPIFPLVILLWLGVSAGVVRAFLQRSASRFAFPLLVALIDLPIELVLVATSGKTFPHYFIPLIPPVAILTAWGTQQLIKFLHSVAVRQRFSAWLPAFAVMLLAGGMFLPSITALIAMSRPVSEMTITTTVAVIQQETKVDDSVLMWGSQTLVNFLAKRAAPTRFVHQKPLFRAGFASRELSEEILRDLQAHPPMLIINTHLPSTPFVTTDAAGHCTPPQNPPDGMEMVFQFICENYTLDQVITKDSWEVYKLQQ